VSLSILNNVAALSAENSLSATSASLQKTLLQLSTGLKIKSGSDDSAGLSIASGLQANIAALSQSQINASTGIGFLQTADGALAQVSSLLNRAVTLATEAGNGNLTLAQSSAANTEYQSILAEINQIGANTEFNGTKVFTDGNSTPIALANDGGTITGTINPLDTLSGGMTVTSTVPGLAGTTTAITASTSGTTTTATIAPGAVLSGGITIDSSKTGSSGTPEALSFTASGDGSTITSQPIVAGDTLSGSLAINSSGGNASDSDTIDLANYQGLASSNATTATNAANQLAVDMTTAIGGTTGSTYSASISGGVLTIQTSNPVPTASAITFPSGPDGPEGINPFIGSGQPLEVGATLAGSISLTSSGGNFASSGTIDFSTMPGLATGLTSDNPATQAVALADLGTELDAVLGGSSGSGSTYTASLDNGWLLIASSNGMETLNVSSSTLTQAPTLGTQNLNLGTQGNWVLYTDAAAPGSVASGMLDVQGSTGTASINLADGYSDIFGTDANAATEMANLNTALNAQLGGGGRYYAWETDGVLGIDDTYSNPLYSAGSTVQATLRGETLSVGGGSDVTQASGSSGGSASQTISLAGQTTAGLQSYLQGQLSDYTVSYNNTTGALSIALNPSNPDGWTASSSTSAAFQNVGSTPAVNTSTTVSLAGLTPTNLASSLLAQLNGSANNYTVSYDQTSGALSIGISGAGTTAGITSISSGNNSAMQTVPTGSSSSGLSDVDIFTSDGTTSGTTSLDVTVGLLSTVSVGSTNGNAGADLSTGNLLTQSAASSTLTTITAAVNDISSQRGAVGANVNRLAATANDESTTQINLTSAMDSTQNADIGKTVANMTEYNILESTGMVALQQADQSQQAILKLIQ
jgi:flagellin